MEENPPVNHNDHLPEESAEESSFATDDPSTDYESGSDLQGFKNLEGLGNPGEAGDESTKPPSKKKKSVMREWAEAVVVAFFGVIILKAFLFEPFAIPSDSMSGTLMAGDYVVVNKLSYGARLPITPLTIPFTHQSIFGMRSYSDAWQLPYMRIPGFGGIDRNDVIVFNFPAEELFPLDTAPTDYPIDHRTHFIKRCIALPGDTLQITAKNVFINGEDAGIPVHAMFNYVIKIDSSKADSLNLLPLGMVRESRQGKYVYYTITMKPQRADSLRLNPKIISVEPELSPAGSFDEQVFPHEEKLSWNLDNYGPIVIPKAGGTIHLSVDSLSLWERIIVNYEHNELTVKDDSIFINGQYTETYTFQMDYFFVMGDNRHFSMDSRYWGFVPEDHIVGIATTILFSVDKQNGGVRWGRTFSSIE
jgi:signal peptidase I